MNAFQVTHPTSGFDINLVSDEDFNLQSAICNLQSATFSNTGEDTVPKHFQN